ncbi:hypothetical protein [uncultured Psychroserpens sp.]|uniref:hypothetical protein n=1 Tax=uncultured Psychroserpens sp. TaxID=255436 RepID=UPI00260E3576|nr:hypothetical protein [uncultured Psychroserpens sp.]
MKTNTFKLLTVLALMLSMSCSVDQLQTDYEESVLEEKLKTETYSKKSQNENSNQERTSDPIPLNNPNLIVLNEIPFGTHTYTMYLDMTLLEANYVGSFIGPFNIHYRNEMMNNFTIFSVEYASNPDCGNIERWVVDVHEFNAYISSIGHQDGVIPGHDHTGNSEGGSTSNSTGAGVTDVNGKKKDPPPPDPDNTVIDPDDPDISVDYAYCFSTEIID